MSHTANKDALAQGTHHLIIDGIEQYYHVMGEGPVCIVHSGGPGVRWDYLRMPLIEAFLKLIYLEPIGTGASGRLADPRGYTLARYTRHVDALIDHLAVGTVYFLGHSHGGFVGLRYALDHLQRLSGLILYDTSPTTGPEFGQSIEEALQRFAARHSIRPEVPKLLAAVRRVFAAEAQAAATDEDATRELQQIFPVYFADYWGREREFAPLRESVWAWSDPLRGQEPEPYDVRGELGRIAARTLVLAGQEDAICVPSWAQVLHAGLPVSQLVVLPHSGHFGHLEEPHAFASAVRNFVS
ncbi:alpha/beta hydrolase [Ktedonosporobacter rubrisoli]|uniref:Alpha/beta hydrolase n=1 Tax=Ktedonosporobacter rubrisoli TaxID=2509675 RepID=A0A4P6JLE6_KTERU|nr:alpha/beta hydrolase [Ktedonosporobacter rubrisoli]QBD76014.1 alpha/beta hydrolase [Ktedonosporobacter rubrisoli]